MRGKKQTVGEDFKEQERAPFDQKRNSWWRFEGTEKGAHLRKKQLVKVCEDDMGIWYTPRLYREAFFDLEQSSFEKKKS
jgi:hypothetical protein